VRPKVERLLFGLSSLALSCGATVVLMLFRLPTYMELFLVFVPMVYVEGQEDQLSVLRRCRWYWWGGILLYAASIFLVENFWDPSLFPPFTVYLSLLNVMDSVIFLAYLFRAASEIQAGETPAGVETADGTPFRRRDAVLGVTAVSVLPFLENAVIDWALHQGMEYLEYGHRPLWVFFCDMVAVAWIAVSYWFEKRTFTSGVWWFKKDENTQLLPGGRRAYLWSSALSVAVSLLAMGLCLWVGQRWAAALPLVNGAALWLGFRMLFFGREE